MRKIVRATYIWPDGQRPTAKLRSKERLLQRDTGRVVGPTFEIPPWIPPWGFDGSSTAQTETAQSDLGLKPVYVAPDSIHGDPHILVLCEVTKPNGDPHETNTRARLRGTAGRFASRAPLFGIEQEYTLYDENGRWPLRWPKEGAPSDPQGRYYCGVGSDEVFGRKLIEAHTEALTAAGFALEGTNAEVMPGQWEFQLGLLPAPEICDQLLLARWILYRLGEDLGITVKLNPKPIVAGDWNGAGGHVNFSTKAMRRKDGYDEIVAACEKLRQFHLAHLLVYGAENHERLTGKHETCAITEFRYGIADRGASVRIPASVAERGFGHLEDRRPAANADPYQVCTALLETVCGEGFDPRTFRYFLDEELLGHLLLKTLRDPVAALLSERRSAVRSEDDDNIEGLA